MRFGEIWLGRGGSGTAGMARRGMVCSGEEWRGRADKV